jgi:glucokinase
VGAQRPEGVLLGVDLGGTQVKAARFSRSGEREAVARAASPSRESAEAILGAVLVAARELSDSPAGVGIGVAGVLDLREGRVVHSPNLPALSGFPLRERLRSALGGVPVQMMNDANAAALGEFHAGAGQACRSMVLLTLGTGIGGGVVLDGKIWEGAAGAAGEVGHMCVQADGPECSCGGRGCLEACVSGWALIRDAKAAAKDPASAIASLPEITAERLAGLALAGDAGARSLWESAGRMLGIGVANLMNLLNPECIVLAGGLARAGDLLLAPARRAWERQAFELARASCQVRLASLGEWAGVRGAIQPFLS